MRALFLDKDGTLTKTVSGEKFVRAPWDQKPIDGVTETLAKWVANGWAPIIVSNQQGVEYGHKTLEECFLEMRFALELFPTIKEAYFCPDAGQTCWRCWGDCKSGHRILYDAKYQSYEHLAGAYRKPGGGMMQLAVDLHATTESFMVGDFKSDEESAAISGIPFQYIQDWVPMGTAP